MKKIFWIAAGIILSTQIAHAEQQTSNICSNLISVGGSHFYASAYEMETTLYYNSNNSDGISGGIARTAPCEHANATLYDSHCNAVTGQVTLRWSSPEFSGNITGMIDPYTKSIRNATGYIDGRYVNTNLILG